MDEFEDVVCEELVENCISQMRKHSARYSELDIITEQSCESGETTRRNKINSNNGHEGGQGGDNLVVPNGEAPPSLLI